VQPILRRLVAGRVPLLLLAVEEDCAVLRMSSTSLALLQAPLARCAGHQIDGRTVQRLAANLYMSQAYTTLKY